MLPPCSPYNTLAVILSICSWITQKAKEDKITCLHLYLDKVVSGPERSSAAAVFLSQCLLGRISMPRTLGTFLPKTSSVVQSSHGRAENLSSMLLLRNRTLLDVSGLLGKKKKSTNTNDHLCHHGYIHRKNPPCLSAVLI